jgi:hypothetical protein
VAVSHAHARQARPLGVAAVRLGAGILVMAALGAGAFAWAASSRPADPLDRYPGLGFEGSGATAVHLGQPVAFATFIMGATPSSRATITGVILPHIPGIRLHVYGVAGSPQGGMIGPLTTPRGGDPRWLRSSQLVPIAGRSLRPPPAGTRPHLWRMTIALIATPTRHGCVHITGVGIRYRVGDTTFTKRMDGAVSVATGHRSCI